MYKRVLSLEFRTKVGHGSINTCNSFISLTAAKGRKTPTLHFTEGKSYSLAKNTIFLGAVLLLMLTSANSSIRNAPFEENRTKTYVKKVTSSLLSESFAESV